MDYKKIYNTLISRSKNRILEGYQEKHHIIPRCMGGKDDTDNLVNLTPEEHYLAHQLLVKIYPNNDSLVYAASMMIPKRPSNKMYGWLRRRLSTAKSKEQSESGNNQFGKSWYHNNVTKERKVFLPNDIPDGWVKGRSFTETRVCGICNNNFTAALYEKTKYCSKECRSAAHSKYQTGKTPGNAIILSEKKIKELVKRYTSGESVSDIHKEYGIGQRKAYYLIKKYTMVDNN